MTANRRAKREIRSRMAESGEKYTQARRVLSAPPPPGAAERAGTGADEGDPIGWFTDQGHNAILLAEDDARMLGHPRVEPLHLLLAASRHGNVERLLAREGLSAAAIHAAIVRSAGFGSDLVLGRVPRGAGADAALWRAVGAAAERGSGAPSTEHLLLGLAGDGATAAILRDLGLADATSAVDAAHPVRRPPLGPEERRRGAAVARARIAPRPGPMPPLFERFSAGARAAVDAANESAGSIGDGYVTPSHILAALLQSDEEPVARARAAHGPAFAAARGRALELLAEGGRGGTPLASPEARLLLAEHVLVVARRLGHRPLTAGHLLVAALGESEDETVAAIRRACGEPGAIARRVLEELGRGER